MHMAQSQELEAADLRPFNLGLTSGFKKAQDRTTWRALTGCDKPRMMMMMMSLMDLI